MEQHILNSSHQPKSAKKTHWYLNNSIKILALQEFDHIKNTVVLLLSHIECLHLMDCEITWVLVFSGTQIKPQIIIDTYYLLDYLFFSYYYGNKMCFSRRLQQALKEELILKTVYKSIQHNSYTVTNQNWFQEWFRKRLT